jgi:hypothetical protein
VKDRAAVRLVTSKRGSPEAKFLVPSIGSRHESKIGCADGTQQAAVLRRSFLADDHRRVIITTSYLFVCFSAVLFYRMPALHSYGIDLHRSVSPRSKP